MFKTPKKRQGEDTIDIYDPHTDRLVKEKVYGQGAIRWAYASPVSPLLEKLCFHNRWGSRLLGKYFDLPLSKRKIAPFVRDYEINLSEAVIPGKGFRSFNDFFSRKIRPGCRPFNSAAGALVSPADARTLVFPHGVGNRSEMTIKGVPFTLSKLLSSPQEDIDCLASGEQSGPVVICRLCPTDYHRFHFPASGRKVSSWDVPGYYHSVNPLPLRLGIKVFESNFRHVSILNLAAFGTCAYVEVGAFGVARIRQTHTGAAFAKMDEKGFFQFGASTIVLVFSPETVNFRDDLVHWSEKGIETLIKAGETLGQAR